MTKDFWFKYVDPLESTVAIATAYEQNYIPKQCRCYSSSEMKQKRVRRHYNNSNK